MGRDACHLGLDDPFKFTGCHFRRTSQFGVIETGVNSIVGQYLSGVVNKVVLERNGTVVVFDSRVDQCITDVLGRGSCNLGLKDPFKFTGGHFKRIYQSSVHKTGVNSIVGKELSVGFNKVASERSGMLVGVGSRVDGEIKSVIISTVLHEDLADISNIIGASPS